MTKCQNKWCFKRQKSSVLNAKMVLNFYEMDPWSELLTENVRRSFQFFVSIFCTVQIFVYFDQPMGYFQAIC